MQKGERNLHSIPQKSHIAVLIPCFNEALTIKKVVRDFASVLPEADIYVYDNNSSDCTADIAKEAGAIVIHEYRQGKGNVIRSMFRDIEADCYVMVDGDDTYPAENAPEMARLVLEEQADMVVLILTALISVIFLVIYSEICSAAEDEAVVRTMVL